MKLGSLFDGSGGFPLAGVLNGIEPVWASEIEPFPIRVTTKRFPQMKHYGNICEVNGAEVEPVDIITGGSPCQDLSVAGKRAGMKHSEFGDEETTRSGLFMEQIRIIKEMREATNGEYPRYMVWENVPGAFSSNKGKDFQAVLEETIRIADETATVPEPPKGKWANAGCIVGDGYSVAWRVLDAQFWGVPQRRRRIFLVADFRGESAGEILLKRGGLRRDSAEGFRAWQGTACGAQGCAGEAVGFDGYNSCLTGDASATLGVNCGMSTGRNGVIVLNEQGGMNTPLVLDTPKTLKIRSGCEGGGKGVLIQDDKSATLGCNNDQTVFLPTAYGICSYASNSMKSDNPHSGVYVADTARTLDLNDGNPACNQGGIAVIDTAICFEPRSQDGVPRIHGDISPTINTAQGGQRQPCVANNGGQFVRRLTPLECSRLQGFPDWWVGGLATEEPTEEDITFWAEVFETHRKVVGGSSKPKSRNQIIKWLKDPYSDSAIYKMWGNGLTVFCAEYVMEGIVEVGRD